MIQRRLWYVAISLLDLYQVFYNIGMILFDPHYPQHHPSSHVYGLGLATSAWSWHVWQGYGGAGPLLWLKEGCDVFAISILDPHRFYNIGMLWLALNHPQHHTYSHVYVLRLAISGHTWTVLWQCRTITMAKERCDMFSYPYWTCTKCFITLRWYHLTNITLNHPSSHVYGLRLATSAWSWHVWQGYGNVGPLLWLREGCYVFSISILDPHQFYNIGMLWLALYHPQYHTYNSGHGLRLATRGHTWQDYGRVGPLLWPREGCDVLPYPCYT